MVADKDQRCIESENCKKPITIRERYPSTHDRILKLNNVEDKEDLPVLWYQMTNWRKDGESLLVSMQNQVTISANHYDKNAF